jgi:hypothetical protein
VVELAYCFIHGKLATEAFKISLHKTMFRNLNNYVQNNSLYSTNLGCFIQFKIIVHTKVTRGNQPQHKYRTRNKKLISLSARTYKTYRVHNEIVTVSGHPASTAITVFYSISVEVMISYLGMKEHFSGDDNSCLSMKELSYHLASCPMNSPTSISCWLALLTTTPSSTFFRQLNFDKCNCCKTR